MSDKPQGKRQTPGTIQLIICDTVDGWCWHLKDYRTAQGNGGNGGQRDTFSVTANRI
jgi:hypothetical protein